MKFLQDESIRLLKVRFKVSFIGIFAPQRTSIDLVLLNPFRYASLAKKPLTTLALLRIKDDLEANRALKELSLHLALFLRGFLGDDHTPRR